MSEFDAWIHISLGTLTVETGVTAPHYAPDVIRDMWTQAVTGLKETIETAAALGLVAAEETVAAEEEDE